MFFQDLNTSYVKVQFFFTINIFYIYCHLNTSYVKVQLDILKLFCFILYI